MTKRELLFLTSWGSVFLFSSSADSGGQNRIIGAIHLVGRPPLPSLHSVTTSIPGWVPGCHGNSSRLGCNRKRPSGATADLFSDARFSERVSLLVFFPFKIHEMCLPPQQGEGEQSKQAVCVSGALGVAQHAAGLYYFPFASLKLNYILTSSQP